MSKGIFGIMKQIRHDEERKLKRKLHPLYLTEEYKEAERAHKKHLAILEEQKQKINNKSKSDLATSDVEPLIKLQK